jgi:hypothetical protein
MVSIKYFSSIVLLLTAFTSGVHAQSKGDPPSVASGLQIKRSYLVKQIQSSDSTMAFKQYADLNDEQIYKGVDADGTSVQFLGKENKLKEVVWTFKFSEDKGVNLLQYKRLAYFVFLMSGQNGVAWLESCAAEFVGNNKKSFYNTKTFDFDRKGFYKYEPANKEIIITFKSF